MEEVIEDWIDKVWQNDRVIGMQKLAEEYVWEFAGRQRFAEQPTAIKDFKLFKGKKGKRIIGMMDLGRYRSRHEARIYDYIYYGDGGKKKTTVVEVRCMGLDLSPFCIQPKSGIKNLFRPRIKSNGNPALAVFNKHYEIEAVDIEATDVQVPDGTLELIADDKKVWLEGDGEYVIYYQRKKQMPVHQLLDAHAFALEIVDTLVRDDVPTGFV